LVCKFPTPNFFRDDSIGKKLEDSETIHNAFFDRRFREDRE
jgi:hypothetical protein